MPDSLPTIIGAFKSAVTHASIFCGMPRSPVWQRNYYEHIIRDETSLKRIREYIINNPLSWNWTGRIRKGRRSWFLPVVGQFQSQAKETIRGTAHCAHNRRQYYPLAALRRSVTVGK